MSLKGAKKMVEMYKQIKDAVHDSQVGDEVVIVHDCVVWFVSTPPSRHISRPTV